MRRRRLTRPDGTGTWGGLALDVGPSPAPYGPAADTRRPGLRVEVATGRRLLIRQGTRPVLFARVDALHYGVDVHQVDGFRSPAGPPRAGHARALADHDADPLPRWAEWFADRLAYGLSGEPDGAGPGPGPLHPGRWVLTRHSGGWWSPGGRPPDGWQLVAHHNGHVNWFTTPCAWDVLPLRRPSPPDAGRVRAYRRQAREGILPPVLLWWVSGLQCHTLLDGHDRFVAALAEGRDPPVLVLARRGDERARDRHRAAVVEHYTASMAAIERAGTGSAALGQGAAAAGRRLGATLGWIEEITGPTRAWPVAGGAAAWRAQAAAYAPDWTPRDDRHGAGYGGGAPASR